MAGKRRSALLNCEALRGMCEPSRSKLRVHPMRRQVEEGRSAKSHGMGVGEKGDGENSDLHAEKLGGAEPAKKVTESV